jgi:hypothetical protein
MSLFLYDRLWHYLEKFTGDPDPLSHKIVNDFEEALLEPEEKVADQMIIGCTDREGARRLRAPMVKYRQLNDAVREKALEYLLQRVGSDEMLAGSLFHSPLQIRTIDIEIKFHYHSTNSLVRFYSVVKSFALALYTAGSIPTIPQHEDRSLNGNTITRSRKISRHYFHFHHREGCSEECGLVP